MPDEAALERDLSEPEAAAVETLRGLPGDILVLGASGKMGPSMARLALRCARDAGSARRVVGVSRFSEPGVREALERDGVETIAANLLDPVAVERLPDAPLVVYMVGRKFGTGADQSLTWATNVYAAALAAGRYRASRFVAFSTGNVYPLAPVTSSGPAESDPAGPTGEYAQSALGRERILEYFSRRHGTPMAILRLNYAVEPRYGVLRDVAEKVWNGVPIDLSMGHINVIWQRDANAIALCSFARCASPPLVLNVTGSATLSIRDLAWRFGCLMGRTPQFTGAERSTALLSKARKCWELLGRPETPLDVMVARVGMWVMKGGRGLGKPTHYEEREGAF